MDINPLCVLCRSKVESTQHLLWECKFSKSVWSVFFPNLLSLLAICKADGDPYLFWEELTKRLEDEELSNATIPMWKLWTLRNKAARQDFKPDHIQFLKDLE